MHYSSYAGSYTVGPFLLFFILVCNGFFLAFFRLFVVFSKICLRCVLYISLFLIVNIFFIFYFLANRNSVRSIPSIYAIVTVKCVISANNAFLSKCRVLYRPGWVGVGGSTRQKMLRNKKRFGIRRKCLSLVCCADNSSRSIVLLSLLGSFEGEVYTVGTYI